MYVGRGSGHGINMCGKLVAVVFLLLQLLGHLLEACL
jgi:hypothetical protein